MSNKATFGPITDIPVPENATPAGFETPTGDLAIGQLDGSGNLKVSVTGAGSGGTSSVDRAGFTAGSTAGTPAMGVYEATPTTVANNQVGLLRMDADRHLQVDIVSGGGSNASVGPTGDPVPSEATLMGIADPGGDLMPLAAETLDYDTGAGSAPQTVIGIALPASGGPVAGGTTTNPLQVGDAGGSLTVDGTVTANAGTNLNTSALALEATLSTLNGKVTAVNTGAVVVASSALPSGAATSALQTQPGVDIGDVTVNNAAGAAAVNVQDGGNSLTVDYATTGSGTATGALRVELPTNGTGVLATVGAVTTITNAVTVAQATASSLNAQAVGNIAHDAADSGNPVKVGGVAFSPDGTTPGTAVAESDRSNLKTDLNGRLFVNPNSPQALTKHLDGSSAYTDEAIIADPGDGFQAVITNIIGSTGAATALSFFLEEGSTKIFGPIYLEAVAGRGFCSGPMYLPCTASTAVTLTSSASIAQSFQIAYFLQAV